MSGGRPELFNSDLRASELFRDADALHVGLLPTNEAAR
jgi:hypothetical protein